MITILFYFCIPPDFYLLTHEKKYTTFYFSRFGAKSLKRSVMGASTLFVNRASVTNTKRQYKIICQSLYIFGGITDYGVAITVTYQVICHPEFNHP